MRNPTHSRRGSALHLLALLLAALALLSPPARLAQGPDEQLSRETIEPGIEHRRIVRVGREDVTDRWLINILEVNPARARLVSALALDEIVGSEATSSIASRHGAIAAINGGYFRTTGIVRGEPAGTFLIGGKWLSEPVPGRAGLVIGFDTTGTRAAVTHIEATTDVRASGGASRKIDGINRPRESDELILYTPEFHRTTLTGPDGIEAAVVAGRVASITSAGSRMIPANGFVLSASGAAKAWIERNIRLRGRVMISTVTKAHPAVPFRIGFAIGGGPQLISEGRQTGELEFRSFSQSLIQMRHPRTAFGIRRDGTLLLVTVDGRQPAVSVGMTIAELTSFMLELDCREALNLDGGGSTTMVIRDKVVNHPSDQTGERPVSDAVLIFARR